jgi:hypothetical protein
MLEACLRFLNALDASERIPVIAPMIMWEIHYYLLTGPEGGGFQAFGNSGKPKQSDCPRGELAPEALPGTV